MAYAELDQIFNTSANGMRVVDRNHTVIRANRAFCKLAGLDEKEVVGRKCYETFSGSACNTDQCPLTSILKKPQLLEDEVTKVISSGRRIECAVTSTPYYGANGELIGIIEDFKDITRYKELEQLLRDTAITDELTGLFNRRGFLTLAEKQLGSAIRAEYDLFVVYADLDNMKTINDTLGHGSGDLALTSTAGLLQDSFRQSDILARLGGDEFAVMVTCKPGADSEQAILDRLEERVLLENQRGGLPFTLSINFGVVQMEPDETLDHLIIRADNRMYEKKIQRKGGRNERKDAA